MNNNGRTPPADIERTVRIESDITLKVKLIYMPFTFTQKVETLTWEEFILNKAISEKIESWVRYGELV